MTYTEAAQFVQAIDDASKMALTDAAQINYRSVLVGPMLPLQCDQVDAWTLSVAANCRTVRSTYIHRVGYQCPLASQVALPQPLPAPGGTCSAITDPTMDFSAFGRISVGVSIYQLAEVLESIMKAYSWRSLLIVYQKDPTDNMREVADQLVLQWETNKASIRVTDIRGWAEELDYKPIISPSKEKHAVCLMLGQLRIVASFLLAIKQTDPEQIGSAPFIVFDQTVFSEDARRIWEGLSKSQPELGTLTNTPLLLVPHPYQLDLPTTVVAGTEETYKALSLAVGFALQVHLQTMSVGLSDITAGFFANINGSTLKIPVGNPETVSVTFGKAGKPVDAALDFTMVLPSLAATGTGLNLTKVASLSWPDYAVKFRVNLPWDKEPYDAEDLPECEPESFPRLQSNPDLRFPTLNSEPKLNAGSASRVALSADDPTKSLASVISGDGISDTNTARYNNGLVYVKRLDLENPTLKRRFLDTVRTLREIRNENINQMIGCYVDISSLCIVFEHCSRGSLKDVINKESIVLDWEFKLSLITDVVKQYHVDSQELVVSNPFLLERIRYLLF
ncbi:unnamed protein product [Dicrocoelium dendriticum]|nr:unnamed protein product [Dicrocoelium dendriticum]